VECHYKYNPLGLQDVFVRVVAVHRWLAQPILPVLLWDSSKAIERPLAAKPVPGIQILDQQIDHPKKVLVLGKWAALWITTTLWAEMIYLSSFISPWSYFLYIFKHFLLLVPCNHQESAIMISFKFWLCFAWIGINMWINVNIIYFEIPQYYKCYLIDELQLQKKKDEEINYMLMEPLREAWTTFEPMLAHVIQLLQCRLFTRCPLVFSTFSKYG
jgi:hypothetical protein